ncbi:unnamed protein product [Arabis nemorensis]|uniref:Uncharacterized protein n=1 Tax=Arabis nemorensis TaxID=586526 RepID=A0A565B6H0_9BRAS|nr:unnamed protein product [Arabis nemorensis]
MAKKLLLSSKSSPTIFSPPIQPLPDLRERWIVALEPPPPPFLDLLVTVTTSVDVPKETLLGLRGLGILRTYMSAPMESGKLSNCFVFSSRQTP